METLCIQPVELDVVEIEELQPTCHALDIVAQEEVVPTCHQ